MTLIPQRKTHADLSATAIGVNIEASSNVYRRMATFHITYKASNAKSIRAKSGGFVDPEADGGMVGHDVRIVEKSPHQPVHVEGIDRHQRLTSPLSPLVPTLSQRTKAW